MRNLMQYILRHDAFNGDENIHADNACVDSVAKSLEIKFHKKTRRRQVPRLTVTIELSALLGVPEPRMPSEYGHATAGDARAL
jgi:hypothetical protein